MPETKPVKTIETTVKMNIVGHRELYGLLPEETQRNEELWGIFCKFYAHELCTMLEYAAKCAEPYVGFYPWRRSGSQWIAEFEVNDRARPRRDEINWHGQNTSQWAYAGCLLYDERDRRLSAHH